MRGCFLMGCLVFGLSAPAFANDSVAELGAGGLVLVRGYSVSMAKEELFISQQKVTVDYVFKNDSGADVVYLVAFPMPMLDPDDYLNSDISVPKPQQENFMNFTVRADGQKVVPELEMRALSGSLDVTDELVSLGIPLNPLFDKTNAALAALPLEKLKSVIQKGAVLIENEKAQAAWTLKSTYYWKQNFANGRPTLINHTYEPAVGGGFFSVSASKKEPYYDRFCIDQSTQKAIGAVVKTLPTDAPYLSESRVAYILSSGANWAGSIGDFRLVIDKGNPDTIVSFCMDGVKKIAPTQFEVRKKDFVPDKDLAILFLRKPGP